MATVQQPSVAVIGLGAQGLVTVKNLLEQGFKVTGFDRNGYVGGIWHFSQEHHVSALPTTFVNVSRERACFTDFPFPDEAGSYPSSGQVDQYLNDYADAFKLRPHLRLSTTINAIERDEARNGWKVVASTSSSSETLGFDKIVMATGPHNKPVMPDIPGRQNFNGEILHSIAFKDHSHFQGKRVLVVGASNSAADTATGLIGVASKVYLSHRHGSVVLPRFLQNGKSLDHELSYQQFQIKEIVDAWVPRLSMRLLDGIVQKIQHREFGPFDPQWRLQPTPSLLHQNPTVTDSLVPALRAGTIVSAHGPKLITENGSVELEDGSEVAVDSIVCCTGYSLDYSVLGQYDPTLDASTLNGHDRQTPRLYQNVFSIEYPESLCFVGVALSIFPAFLLSDLSSMAIAQLWSNKPNTPSLPSQREMERWHVEHLAWVKSVRALSSESKFVKLTVRSRLWMPWITQMGDCNLDNHLGYFGLDSWKLWWHDRPFYSLLANGIWSPHIYRLFDPTREGGRKKWIGARQAIIRVNEHVKANVDRREKENS